MGVCTTERSKKKEQDNTLRAINEQPNPKIKKNNKNQVIILVKYNENEPVEFLLDKNQKISDLINELKLDLDCDYDFYDSNQILINDKINEQIKNIFDIKNPISITIKKYSLQLSKNNREFIIDNTSLIGTLTFNNPSLFGIFIYNMNYKRVLSYEYPFENYSQLHFINKFTTFCNANNNLYISGGENENEKEGNNNFIKINLEQIQQEELIYNNLTNLKHKRYWHSMIFVPEKYIYIIGGPGIKDVEMYDIVENDIKIDGKLNYERCEPSLILVNNKYLYCICGFQLDNNFLDTIEKCNLYKRERSWELVNYQIKAKEENRMNLIMSFFGVSYINDDIILIGDKEDNKIINPNYLLKPNEKEFDIIEEYGFIESDNTRLFTEKFFIPFNNNESAALPFKSGEPKILILNNNDGNIKEIIFKEENEENHLDIDSLDNN
jgi:hypothetical protein